MFSWGWASADDNFGTILFKILAYKDCLIDFREVFFPE
jgi:hypothetical protein